MIELSRYAFSILQEGEFALYRGCADGLDPILLVAPDGERSAIQAVKRFSHEYALRTALDSALGGATDRTFPLSGSNCTRPGRSGRATPRSDAGQAVGPAAILLISRSRSRLRAVGCTGAGLSIKISSRPTFWWVRTGTASDFHRVRLASRLAREQQAPGPPEVIAGTLAYMAPEQTGRMNGP